MKKINLKVNLDAKKLKEKMGLKDGIDGKNGIDGKTPIIDTDKLATEASTRAVESLKPLIPTLQQLEQNIPILGNEIRDSLELLQGDDRLDKDAIRGLDDYEEISRLARQPKITKQIMGGGGAKSLQQVTDIGDTTTKTITVGGLITNGGIIGKITTVTDTYIILGTDETIVGNKASPFTMTLPVTIIGTKYVIKNKGVGAITIEGNGIDLVNGNLNQILYSWEGATFQCDASGSWITY